MLYSVKIVSPILRKWLDDFKLESPTPINKGDVYSNYYGTKGRVIKVEHHSAYKENKIIETELIIRKLLFQKKSLS